MTRARSTKYLFREKAPSGLRIDKRRGRIEEADSASKYALRRSLHISVCNSHTAGGIYAEGGTYVRWFPAEGEIISVPRMMGMNKKCARNNGVDLWILEEDGITYI